MRGNKPRRRAGRERCVLWVRTGRVGTAGAHTGVRITGEEHVQQSAGRPRRSRQCVIVCASRGVQGVARRGEDLHDSARRRPPPSCEIGWTRLPVKIAPTTIMADDGSVCDVVSFWRHRCCRSWHPARDLGLPDRTMMTPSMPLSILRASF